MGAPDLHPKDSVDQEGEPLMPSKIVENLKDSNVGEMFRNMSVNEQMKLIH